MSSLIDSVKKLIEDGEGDTGRNQKGRLLCNYVYYIKELLDEHLKK